MKTTFPIRTALSLLCCFAFIQSPAFSGEMRGVEALVKRGNTPLHLAALAGDAREVERLLATGASARATNFAGATALHYGAGNARIVEVLLRAGADPNARSVVGLTPLHSAAARYGASAGVEMLLKAGAKVDARRPVVLGGEITALTPAAFVGDERTVSLLLKHGANPGGTNGYTPVAAAAFAGRTEILKTLLAAGGNINVDDGFAGHALNNALYAGHHATATMLMSKKPDFHQVSTFGERVPAMVWSAYNEEGDARIAKALLERGVDVNEPTSAGDTALRWAMKRGETPLTALLRSRGATEGTRPLKRKTIPQNSVPDESEARKKMIRDSTQRAVRLLQRSSDSFLANGFVQQVSCVSCHQQTLPAIAYALARKCGPEVDETSLARQLRVQRESWSKTRDAAYEMFEPQPAVAAVVGYGLRGLHALNYGADELTDAMVWYLAESQLPDGSWPDFDRRPPMEEGRVVGTALTVSSLRLYPQPMNRKLDRQIARATKWFREFKPADLNQRTFRMLGLVWGGAKSGEVKRDVEALRALQRADGGWAGLPGIESDAWATGLTLYALHEVGIGTDDAAYQRGVAFLLRTQFPDGSWWVPSRTWPFQPHFDSDFPHGKDQWISAGGTAWAAIALLRVIEPANSPMSFPSGQELIAKYKALPATAAQVAQAGASAADHPLEFKADIQPLLKRSCAECHGGEKPKGGFVVDSLDSLFKPGQSGETAIVRGKGAASPLVKFISDQVEDLEMPPKNRRSKFPALTMAEVQRVRDWIDQGAR